MVSWAQRIQWMLQGKPTKEMADFLNIFTLCTQQLICAVTYQKFQGKVRSATLQVYNDVIGP